MHSTFIQVLDFKYLLYLIIIYTFVKSVISYITI